MILSLLVMMTCALCWSGSIYLILVRRFKNKAALLRYNRLVLIFMLVNLLFCWPLLYWLMLNSSEVIIHHLLVIAIVTDSLSTGGLLAFVFYSLSVRHRALPSRETRIVVLGAATHDGHVPPVLAARLNHAIACWLQQPSAKVIVTGGVVHQESSSEAAAMARYLQKRGIPQAQIIIEGTAKNTWQNLTASAKLIEPGQPVVVVTSDFHVLRVKSYLKKLHLNWQVTGARTPAGHCPLTFVRDYLGLLRDHRWSAILVLLFTLLLCNI